MKRLLLSILSGLLFAFSWPTYGFPFLLFLAFVPLLYFERDFRLKPSRFGNLKFFACAYLAFFIWNFVTTSWLRFADIFGASFAVLVNSLLMALVLLISHLAAKRTTQIRGQIFFATIWISFEMLHLNWEFSWPWLNLGNGFSEYYKLIQWYEYTGTFGGTLWILALNILIFNSIVEYKKVQKAFKLVKILPSLLLLVIPIIISLVIYGNYENHGKDINVIALQPNIDPYSLKYDTPNDQISDLFIKLTDTQLTDSTDFVIAPETVFAQNVRLNQYESSFFKYKLDSYVKEHPNLNLLTGVSFIELITEKDKVQAESNEYNDSIWYNDYNSAIMLNSTGKTQFYNKSKLVVGVENFPYQEFLKPLIGDAMIDLGGTVSMKTTQKERGVFKGYNSDLYAAPIICYESVYGEFVTGYVRNGANFLAIITNDGWWNETQGHKQHLSYARLRAIETRRQIVRSANTGISALIDDKGDIMDFIPYAKQGALAGTLKTNEKMTFYVMAGDYIARIALFIMIFLGLVIFFRKPRVSSF
ncbi:Apolipoprotein N-acyltransferase [Flavobacteriaceae bacterium MAR_2010_188]|nr:Apolipoprotein N-acyltransferase [Flavobacteriaceae bacterium MAR_2010_188]